MSKSRQDDLLAAIQRKSPHGATGESNTTPSVDAAPRARIGKPVQFWMHEEDRRILRELSAWLAGQGVRASDSLVIRTALRAAKTGSDLLEAYRDAAQLDGRFKPKK